MYKRLYRYWILIPLLLLALVARDWVEEPVLDEIEETIDMTSTKADYYLEDFETRKLNADGSPEYIVNGKSLIHYPADDVSEITLPNLTLHRGDSTWTVVSPKGRLTTKPDVFTLEGEVTMRRLATEQRDAIVILTSDVRVHTAENRVETDQAIEMKSPTWTLKSTGFVSKLDAGKLTLLSNVEGHYEIVN